MFICINCVAFFFVEFIGLNNEDDPGPVWVCFDKIAQTFIDQIYVF